MYERKSQKKFQVEPQIDPLHSPEQISVIGPHLRHTPEQTEYRDAKIHRWKITNAIKARKVEL